VLRRRARISGYKICTANQSLLVGCKADRYEPALHPAFLDRGAQTINRIIYPAATGARIDYEMHILPEARAPQHTTSILVGIDKPTLGGTDPKSQALRSGWSTSLNIYYSNVAAVYKTAYI
jgi:hypothetical protein